MKTINMNAQVETISRYMRSMKLGNQENYTTIANLRTVVVLVMGDLWANTSRCWSH